jgi:hypothetical protein
MKSEIPNDDAPAMDALEQQILNGLESLARKFKAQL